MEPSRAYSVKMPPASTSVRPLLQTITLDEDTEVSDPTPTNRADRFKLDDKEYRDAIRAYLLEVTNINLQGVIYLIIMNGVVVFGTLTILKDITKPELIRDIGIILSCFCSSALIGVLAYILLSIFRVHIFHRMVKFDAQKFNRWPPVFYFGFVTAIISVFMFFLGSGWLIMRLVKL